MMQVLVLNLPQAVGVQPQIRPGSATGCRRRGAQLMISVDTRRQIRHEILVKVVEIHSTVVRNGIHHGHHRDSGPRNAGNGLNKLNLI